MGDGGLSVERHQVHRRHHQADRRRRHVLDADPEARPHAVVPDDASANAAVKSEPSTASTPAAAVALSAPLSSTVASSVVPTATTALPLAKGTPPLPTPAAQRPNLVVQTPVNNGVVTPSPATGVALPTAAGALAATVKAEPHPVATTAVTVAAVLAAPPVANGAAAASPSGAAAKNEQLEKIEFAKKLLFHASTCTLASGVCQVTKCDDVRRVFKHSASCGGARSCSHCEQLKGLVKYHAKECLVAASDHCTIPFCDGLRRAYLTAAAVQAAKKAPTAASAGAGSKAGGTSDDDDDNTPLSSAVSKAKKNAVKAKSPKASPTVRPSAVSAVPSSSAAAAKKKTPVPSPATASKPSATATTAATTTAPTTTTTTTTTTPAASTAAANASKPAAPAKTAVTANMTVEYGRLLQLILHVQKCTATVCPVGDECTEAKALLREINSPNAPPRAKTYKQVYSHHKVCLAKNNTGNCPMCKIGMRPILQADTSPLASPASQTTPTSASNAPASSSSAASAAGGGSSPSSGKRSNSTVTPSPRSPSKKPRTGGGNSRVKSAAPLPDPAQSASGAEQPGLDLAQASIADIRREADVLTHTTIDVGSERRAMADSALRRRADVAPELLPCKKEEWLETDLFKPGVLRAQMQALAQRTGVQLGAHSSDVMAYALNEYLKQVIEEMVAVSKQRCDVQARALAARDAADMATAVAAGKHVEVTATDILRVSCEDSFARLRQEDLALRARLLEDAKREELAEKERAKKRKKVDRSRLNQEEKDEAEMDIEELAVKDLKDRLLQEDKDGVVRVDGRVNESIAGKFARRLDQQVALEDATYWLQSQKPYISPKLFARAEAARIVTKSLT
ncbi:hypothetical protein PybrP1_003326 [[Pythium] brassicae (nom. inval.)]|nr:hypothetical protein PybrP1_003326 [[Pythium] brassicae (nom. inval.)]